MSHFVFGRTSTARLATCHALLQKIAMRALELTPIDFTIVWGWRGMAEQSLMVKTGASKTPWPRSKHNEVDSRGNPESLALDFAPWVKETIPWGDTHAFAVIAGVFFAAAEDVYPDLMLPILRWGGDWDMDGSTQDQTFMDWGHIELVEEGYAKQP